MFLSPDYDFSGLVVVIVVEYVAGILYLHPGCIQFTNLREGFLYKQT
jgi:hypothetical protein